MGKISIRWWCVINKLLPLLLIAVLCVFTICLFYKTNSENFVCYEKIEIYETGNEPAD